MTTDRDFEGVTQDRVREGRAARGPHDRRSHIRVGSIALELAALHFLENVFGLRALERFGFAAGGFERGVEQAARGLLLLRRLGGRLLE